MTSEQYIAAIEAEAKARVGIAGVLAPAVKQAAIAWCDGITMISHAQLLATGYNSRNLPPCDELISRTDMLAALSVLEFLHEGGCPLYIRTQQTILSRA